MDDGNFLLGDQTQRIRAFRSHSFYSNFAGMKNVMLITSTTPFIGVTIDDGRQKPALYKQYDFG